MLLIVRLILRKRKREIMRVLNLMKYGMFWFFWRINLVFS